MKKKINKRYIIIGSDSTACRYTARDVSIYMWGRHLDEYRIVLVADGVHEVAKDLPNELSAMQQALEEMEKKAGLAQG